MVLISKVIETNYISERNKMIIYSQPYVKSLLKIRLKWNLTYICTRTRPYETGDVLSGEPQTPRRNLTGSLGRSKYTFHKLQDGLLGCVFLTTQGPAATKNVLKGQINWYCHWKLIERGFGRYLNKIKNWKN
jgi:hypothetical protein